MADELSGFPDEPTFNLAAGAEAGLALERLFAAQNLLVKREAEIARLTDERDGKVLVAREDLRAVLSITPSLSWLRGTSFEDAHAAWVRLADAAGVDR